MQREGSASFIRQHEPTRAEGQCRAIVEEKIPFVDSDHGDEWLEAVDRSSTAATSSNRSVAAEDDMMTESQENLARAFVSRGGAAGPSLAERRMQGKLTVSIENNTVEDR